MSYPEVLLWQRLRGAPMGIRFRRQEAIGLHYIADFYCASAKLVIEVDGQVHDQPRAVRHDTERDRFMRSLGLALIRIPAREILRNADEAADAIVALASKPLHHRAAPGGPPPRAGEE